MLKDNGVKMATKTARFTISADNGEVQGMGYRCFLMEFFMDHGLSHEEPINLPDGSTVSVVVRGDEKIVKGVYERLKVEKPKTEEVGKIKLSPLKFSDKEIKPAGQDEIMNMIFRQLNKGIPAVVNMGTVVSGLDKKYGKISKTLLLQTAVLVLIFLSLVFGFGFV